MIKVYTDASYDNNKKVGGIGICIQDGVKQRTISTWTPAEDNNYSELFAIYIAAILINGKKGEIYTDSQTAIGYIRGEVKEKPRTFEQYAKHQRMKLLAYKIRGLLNGISVIKTKGHTKNYQLEAVGNELADILARQGRAKYYNTRR
jgi:ribonuclease HI